MDMDSIESNRAIGSAFLFGVFVSTIFWCGLAILLTVPKWVVIDHGAAEYNRTTGYFQWKDK